MACVALAKKAGSSVDILMRLLTISNLYPRPDQPWRGVFNAQLFSAMAGQLRMPNAECRIQNVCLVPEWRIWKWPEIRKWGEQYSAFSKQNPAIPARPDSPAGGGNHQSALYVSTVYLPVFYIPVIGRGLSWWTYWRALKRLKDLVMESDAVLSTWLYPDGVAATLMADSCRRPAWIMVQGSDVFHLEKPSQRQVVLDACRKVKGIVCVCKSLADRLIDAGVDPHKVHVVPNGVDPELFHYRPFPDAVGGLPEDSRNEAMRIMSC